MTKIQKNKHKQEKSKPLKVSVVGQSATFRSQIIQHFLCASQRSFNFRAIVEISAFVWSSCKWCWSRKALCSPLKSTYLTHGCRPFVSAWIPAICDAHKSAGRLQSFTKRSAHTRAAFIARAALLPSPYFNETNRLGSPRLSSTLCTSCSQSSHVFGFFSVSVVRWITGLMKTPAK